MTTGKAIAEYTRHFRAIIQDVWDDTTAHADYRPLPPGLPASYGQCVSTSHILFAELRRRFPGEDFRPARGRVLALDGTELRPVIDPHVWIAWQHAEFDRTAVIDATADQAGRALLPLHLVATHEALRLRGIVYHAYRIFNDAHDLAAYCQQDEPSIQERVSLLRERFQMKTRLDG